MFGDWGETQSIPSGPPSEHALGVTHLYSSEAEERHLGIIPSVRMMRGN